MRVAIKTIILLCISCKLFANNLDNVGVTSAAIGAISDMITKPYKLLRIIKSSGCIHHFVLSPKDAIEIKNLKLIFAINKDFEKFLGKEAFIYELSTLDKIEVMNDWHIWLNLKNLRRIGDFITEKIIEIDSINSENYLKNLESFHLKIDELQKKINKYKNHKIVSEKKLMHFFTNFSKSNEIIYTSLHFGNFCRMPHKIDPEHFGNKNIVEQIDSLIEDFEVCVRKA